MPPKLTTKVEYILIWKVIQHDDAHSHGNRYTGRSQTAGSIDEVRKIIQHAYHGFEYDKPRVLSDFNIRKRWVVEDELSEEERELLK